MLAQREHDHPQARRGHVPSPGPRVNLLALARRWFFPPIQPIIACSVCQSDAGIIVPCPTCHAPIHEDCWARHLMPDHARRRGGL